MARGRKSSLVAPSSPPRAQSPYHHGRARVHVRIRARRARPREARCPRRGRASRGPRPSRRRSSVRCGRRRDDDVPRRSGRPDVPPRSPARRGRPRGRDRPRPDPPRRRERLAGVQPRDPRGARPRTRRRRGPQRVDRSRLQLCVGIEISVRAVVWVGTEHLGRRRRVIVKPDGSRDVVLGKSVRVGVRRIERPRAGVRVRPRRGRRDQSLRHRRQLRHRQRVGRPKRGVARRVS